jgi:hypothetical protein
MPAFRSEWIPNLRSGSAVSVQGEVCTATHSKSGRFAEVLAFISVSQCRTRRVMAL